MKNLFSLIKASLNGDSNAVSTARLQSYLIIFPIIFALLIFLVIEVWAFAHSINVGKEYHLSNEIIVVFGMLLAHHLSILFSRNKSTSIADVTSSINKIKGNDKTDEAKDDVTNG